MDSSKLAPVAETDPEKERVRRAEALARISYTGSLPLSELTLDPADMLLSPSSKLKKVMTKVKERGLSVEEIFKCFGAEKGQISAENFGAGIRRFGKKLFQLSKDELEVLVRKFDKDGDGFVSLEEFREFCYQIPHVAWKAERLRFEKRQQEVEWREALSDELSKRALKAMDQKNYQQAKALFTEAIDMLTTGQDKSTGGNGGGHASPNGFSSRLSPTGLAPGSGSDSPSGVVTVGSADTESHLSTHSSPAEGSAAESLQRDSVQMAAPFGSNSGASLAGDALGGGEGHSNKGDGMLSSYYANRAGCHTALEAYVEALSDAEHAIQLDKLSSKGYYRKGQACSWLGMQAQAAHAYEAAFRLEPHNRFFKTLSQQAALGQNGVLHFTSPAKKSSMNRSIHVDCTKDVGLSAADQGAQPATPNMHRRLWKQQHPEVAPDTVLYEGSKFFWRTKDKVDLVISGRFRDQAGGSKPWIVLTAFNVTHDKECDPLFIDATKIELAQAEFQDSLKAAKQEYRIRNRTQGGALSAAQETEIEEAVRHSMLANYLLLRVHSVPPTGGSAPKLKINKLSSDKFDGVLTMEPPGGASVQSIEPKSESMEAIQSKFQALHNDFKAQVSELGKHTGDAKKLAAQAMLAAFQRMHQRKHSYHPVVIKLLRGIHQREVMQVRQLLETTKFA